MVIEKGFPRNMRRELQNKTDLNRDAPHSAKTNLCCWNSVVISSVFDKKTLHQMLFVELKSFLSSIKEIP